MNKTKKTHDLAVQKMLLEALDESNKIALVEKAIQISDLTENDIDGVSRALDRYFQYLKLDLKAEIMTRYQFYQRIKDPRFHRKGGPAIPFTPAQIKTISDAKKKVVKKTGNKKNSSSLFPS